MEIKKEAQNGKTILVITGRLDANTSSELEKVILPLIDEGSTQLIVDLEGLEYISSAGLRIFLLALKKMKNFQGKLILCGLRKMIREVFKIAGFVSIFNIVETREQALQIL